MKAGEAQQAADVKVVTFGCRLNAYESDVMAGHAQAAGLAKTIIVNTCAVTAEAEKQARQSIRRLARENPDARIIVTGCSAQIAPERYAAMPEVFRIIGNDGKMKAESYLALQDDRPRVQVNAIMREGGQVVVPAPGTARDIPRAFLQVQNGCDHRCTFCIIPYGRGPSRSVPVGVVAEHLQRLVAGGANEVVLTGVDITAYGTDLPGAPPLGQMIRRVLAQVPSLKRLRFSSLDPVEMDEDLWCLIAEEPRLMPHLHLSLQAGDDTILKRMKRRHGAGDARAVIHRARQLRPDIVFGADIIAGFPTETEAMFQNTLRFVEEADISWLHVFPYSARTGTPAARMPQVPMVQRKERAARLRAAGDAAIQRLLARQIGFVQTVFIEQVRDGVALGRTPHYAEVAFATTAPAGAVVDVNMEKVEGARLFGSPAIKEKVT